MDVIGAGLQASVSMTLAGPSFALIAALRELLS
jgi:hypothetical protein